MKANKALKRMAKIESLTSDMTRRLAKGAPHLSEVLQSLKDAVARVKDALGSQISARTAKKETKPSRKKVSARKKVSKSKSKTEKKAPKAKVKRTAPSKQFLAAPAQASRPSAAVQEPLPD